MQIEDSDAEDDENSGMDREAIANQLFDGDDVSSSFLNVHSIEKNFRIIFVCLFSCSLMLCV